VLLVQKATGSREFSDADAEIVAIQAGQAAVAIKNALLLKEREESYLEAMGALANALNARDPGTFGHTQRVSKNAVLIAKAMGLREEEVEQVRVGALLHDIGYVGVSDAILMKPGPLTGDEFAWIKQHPIIGDRILAPVAALQKARPVVLNHHERYDGAGYPHGLAGDDIPLAARVVTVADAFDAVTEERVYRPGGSVVQALEELRRHTGSQLDPIAVDAFFDVLAQAGRPQQVQRAES
jgi:putative nucleotidyltransferase with HDIG domain